MGGGSGGDESVTPPSEGEGHPGQLLAIDFTKVTEFPNGGAVDESETGFKSQERPLAEYLAQEDGVWVRKLAEDPSARGADARISDDEYSAAHQEGELVELKQIDPPGATSDSVMNSINRSLEDGGQADNIIIDARGSGLTRGEAFRALRARIPGRIASSKGDWLRLRSVRIVGNVPAPYDESQRY